MSGQERTAIINGLIVDGFGRAPFYGDVLVFGDRIEAVIPRGGSPVSGYDAKVVDVSGLVVSPGFVDVHCHSDLTRFAYPGSESRITQGITTEVVGNCGMSAAPVGDDNAAFAALIATIDVTPGSPRHWSTVPEWLEALDRAASATNVAALVGHGSARHAALGKAQAEEPDIGAIADEVRHALEAGCVGASLGLMYAPGESASPQELAAVGEEVARAGGLLAAHMRSYLAADLGRSVGELVAAGSGARLQVSHLRATSAGGQFADTIAQIDDLRQSVDIAADCYPYVAGHATLLQLLPSSVRAAGPDGAMAFRRKPSILAAMLEDAGWRPEQVIVMKASHTPEAVGNSPQAHADPWGWLAQLLIDNDGLVDVAVESGHWADVDLALQQGWVSIGSDGTALSEMHQSSAPHPRSWGAFPAAFKRMRSSGVSLPSAVRRMSVDSAERVRIPSGLLAGNPADITVFAELELDGQASFSAPSRRAVGVSHVFVNGEAVVVDGGTTDARPGRLRKAGASS